MYIQMVELMMCALFAGLFYEIVCLHECVLCVLSVFLLCMRLYVPEYEGLCSHMFACPVLLLRFCGHSWLLVNRLPSGCSLT